MTDEATAQYHFRVPLSEMEATDLRERIDDMQLMLSYAHSIFQSFDTDDHDEAFIRAVSHVAAVATEAMMKGQADQASFFALTLMRRLDEAGPQHLAQTATERVPS